MAGSIEDLLPWILDKIRCDIGRSKKVYSAGRALVSDFLKKLPVRKNINVFFTTPMQKIINAHILVVLRRQLKNARVCVYMYSHHLSVSRRWSPWQHGQVGYCRSKLHSSSWWRQFVASKPSYPSSDRTTSGYWDPAKDDNCRGRHENLLICYQTETVLSSFFVFNGCPTISLNLQKKVFVHMSSGHNGLMSLFANDNQFSVV